MHFTITVLCSSTYQVLILIIKQYVGIHNFYLKHTFDGFLQSRLQWWPNIEIMYGKATELRNLFTDTLNKVTQMSHNPIRLSHMVSLVHLEFM